MTNRTADIHDESAASTARATSPEATGWLARLSGTRTNAHLGMVCDVGVSLLLIGLGVRFNEHGAGIAILTIAGGLLAFSFVEYSFHRWLFHGRPNSARDGHDRHHADPHGYDALPFFLPPLGMLAVAGMLALTLPAGTALLLAGSVAAGYAAYGLAHSTIHAVRFRAVLPMRWAAFHHVHHHHPGYNFGVTSPLWDIVLKTRYVPVRARR